MGKAIRLSFYLYRHTAIRRELPRTRITFPDGSHIFSDQDDIDYTLSKVLGQDVKLMRANMEKPSYEEYWPHIDGLAQREKVTDETMPSQTFFDIAVIVSPGTMTLCLDFDRLGYVCEECDSRLYLN